MSEYERETLHRAIDAALASLADLATARGELTGVAETDADWRRLGAIQAEIRGLAAGWYARWSATADGRPETPPIAAR
jgi:hypothetical protein